MLCRFKSYELFVLVSNRQDQKLLLSMTNMNEKFFGAYVTNGKAVDFVQFRHYFSACVRAYCAAKKQAFEKSAVLVSMNGLGAMVGNTTFICTGTAF